MMKKEDVFLEVRDSEEKEKILLDLIRSAKDFKIKGKNPNLDLVTVSPRMVSGEELICKIKGVAAGIDNDQSCVAQFQVGEHKFVAMAACRLNNDVVHLTFNEKIFRVQRRESFRLKLPRAYQGKLDIEYEDKKVNVELIDISAGGCRFYAPAAWPLKINDPLFAEFKAVSRDKMNLEMIVRHVGKGVDNPKLNTVGVQFKNLSDLTKNRLAALVMDLYREFFGRK